MSATTAAGVALPRRGWRQRAACRDTLPSRWVIPEGQRDAAVTQWHADLCHRCPVFADCAADALDQGDVCVIRAATALTSNTSAGRRLRRVLDALGARRDAS